MRRRRLLDASNLNLKLSFASVIYWAGSRWRWSWVSGRDRLGHQSAAVNIVLTRVAKELYCMLLQNVLRSGQTFHQRPHWADTSLLVKVKLMIVFLLRQWAVHCFRVRAWFQVFFLIYKIQKHKNSKMTPDADSDMYDIVSAFQLPSGCEPPEFKQQSDLGYWFFVSSWLGRYVNISL